MRFITSNIKKRVSKIYLRKKLPIIETYLAEEAIGLIKSLNWEAVKGPMLSIESKNYNLSKQKITNLNNYFKNKKEIPKVYNNGNYYKDEECEGIYINGGVDVDLEYSDEEFIDESNAEWSNLRLRHSLALSSIIQINEIKPSTYINKYKLNQLEIFFNSTKANVVFFNTILSPTQKRNLEK